MNANMRLKVIIKFGDFEIELTVFFWRQQCKHESAEGLQIVRDHDVSTGDKTSTSFALRV